MLAGALAIALCALLALTSLLGLREATRLLRAPAG
jgi:hypothetical protein